METDLVGRIIALIAALGAVFASVIAAMARKKAEYVKIRLKRFEDIEMMKRRYSTPLLKSANELYNKINGIVRKQSYVSRYFINLQGSIMQIHSIGEILASEGKIYLTGILYLFARYFASIEAIKKDIGLLEYDSSKETQAFQRRLRQTVAIFFSGRSCEHFNIRENSIKYSGLIMEGAQVLIGESMLAVKEGIHEPLSFYDFCVRIAEDEDFRKCLTPLINFLDELKEVCDIEYKSVDVDFRWPKFIIFSTFLRELIREIDTAGVITPLKELEKYSEAYLARHDDIQKNLVEFKKAYPDPAMN